MIKQHKEVFSSHQFTYHYKVMKSLPCLIAVVSLFSRSIVNGSTLLLVEPSTLFQSSSVNHSSMATLPLQTLESSIDKSSPSINMHMSSTLSINKTLSTVESIQNTTIPILHSSIIGELNTTIIGTSTTMPVSQTSSMAINIFNSTHTITSSPSTNMSATHINNSVSTPSQQISSTLFSSMTSSVEFAKNITSSKTVSTSEKNIPYVLISSFEPCWKTYYVAMTTSSVSNIEMSSSLESSHSVSENMMSRTNIQTSTSTAMLFTSIQLSPTAIVKGSMMSDHVTTSSQSDSLMASDLSIISNSSMTSPASQIDQDFSTSLNISQSSSGRLRIANSLISSSESSLMSNIFVSSTPKLSMNNSGIVTDMNLFSSVDLPVGNSAGSPLSINATIPINPVLSTTSLTGLMTSSYVMSNISNISASFSYQTSTMPSASTSTLALLHSLKTVMSVNETQLYTSEGFSITNSESGSISPTKWRSSYLTSSLGVCLVLYTSILPSKSSQITSVESISSSQGVLLSPISQSTLSLAEHASKPVITMESSPKSIMTSTPSLSEISTASVLPSVQVLETSSLAFDTSNIPVDTSRVFSSSIELSSVMLSQTSENILRTQSVGISSTVSSSLSVSSVISTTPNTVRPTKHLLLVSLKVATEIDVMASDFRKSLEENLASTYNAALSPRKRRAVTADKTTVNIENTKRDDNDNVEVEFSLIDGSRNTSIDDVVNTFNYFSTAGLQRRLGFIVNSPISAVVPTIRPPVFRHGNVFGMLLGNTSSDSNFTKDTRRNFEEAISSYYKDIIQSTGNISTAIFYWKNESNDNIYFEFYLLANSTPVNATTESSKFSSLNKTEAFASFGWKVLVHPYSSNQIPVNTQSDWIKMTITTTLSANEISQSSFQESLAQKISQVYLVGKEQTRMRRALSSVTSHIVQWSLNAGNHLNIVFFIVDGGVLLQASVAANIMNQVSSATMNSMLASTVVVKPTPFLFVDVSPAPKKPEYWILAMVLIPSVIVILLIVFICWRCSLRGAAPGKKTVNVDMKDEAASKVVENTSVIAGGVSKGNPPLKQLLAAPITVPLNNNDTPTKDKRFDDFRVSQRKKLRTNTLLTESSIGGQSTSLGRGISEAEEDGYNNEDDELTEIEDSDEDIVPSPQPTAREETSLEASRKKYVIEQPIISQNQQQFFTSANLPKNSTPPRSRLKDYETTRTSPLHRESHVESNNDNSSFPVFDKQEKRSAGHINEVVMIKDTDLLKRDPPLRFRKDFPFTKDAQTPPLRAKVKSVAAYSQPQESISSNDRRSHFLPSIHQHTSLTSALETPSDLDLRHKSDVERQRNKQRQREQSLNFMASSGGTTSTAPTRRAWKREQSRIDAILDPDRLKTAKDLTSRKTRARRRLRRKNKIYIQPTMQQQDEIKMETYKSKHSPSPELTEEESKLTNTPTETGVLSEPESDMSMREARRRIHSLLDDTFSTLKKYKHSLIKKDRVTELQPNVSKTAPLTQTPINRPPVVPEPPPPHGRTSTGFPQTTKRTLLQQNPYLLANMNNLGVPVDTLLQWDPNDRQRYLAQNFGMPPYMGVPYPTVPNYQDLYVAPMQHHLQEHGNSIWKRTDNFPPMNSYNDTGRILKSTYPPANGPTTVNISQPLVRAIKEELNRLSNIAPENNNPAYTTRPMIADGIETSTV